MKYSVLGGRWRRFFLTALLYAFFSVAPAMLILRFVFNLDNSVLLAILVGQAFTLLILQKTFSEYAGRILTSVCKLYSPNFGQKETGEDQKVMEVIYDKEDIYNLSFLMLWFLGMTIFVLGAFLPWEIEFRFPVDDLLILLGSTVVLFVIHEALHGLAAITWGKFPIKSLHFGFNMRLIVFYCHADRPMTVSAYRMFAILPMIVTTPVAGLIIWWDPAIWSLLFFSVVFCGCAGDVLVVFGIRGVENDKWIQDHPSEVGFYVLSSRETPIIRDDEPYEPMRNDPHSSSPT